MEMERWREHTVHVDLIRFGLFLKRLASQDERQTTLPLWLMAVLVPNDIYNNSIVWGETCARLASFSG